MTELKQAGRGKKLFQEDWVMRQIESIVDFLIVAVLHKEKNGIQFVFEQKNETEIDSLHEKLLQLIREHRINEAEDLLFDHLNTEDRRYLELAVDFYSRLNALDNETLRANDFSREEIEEGLKDIAQKFGIPLSDLFQSDSGEEGT